MSLLRGSGHGPRGFPQFLDTTEQRRSLTGTLAQSVKRPRRTVKKRAQFRVTFALSLSSLRSRHSSIRGRVASSRAMLIGPVIDRARKSAPSRASLSHLRFVDSPTIIANFWTSLGHAGTHRHVLPLSSCDEIFGVIATFVSSSSTTSKRSCRAPSANAFVAPTPAISASRSRKSRTRFLIVMSRTRELPTFHFINDECETRTPPRKPELEPREFGDKGVSRDRVLNPRKIENSPRWREIFLDAITCRSRGAKREISHRYAFILLSTCRRRETGETTTASRDASPRWLRSRMYGRTMCEMEEPYFLSVHRNRRRTFDGEITSKFRAEELVATRERRGKGEKPHRVTARYNLYERRERTE